MIRWFFVEMHGWSLECCKDAASEGCYILVMSIHKALVFCYFSFSQVSSCSMVYGPIALALYLMVFTCCLTVLLLWSDSVQLSWPGGRLPEHFPMGLFKFLILICFSLIFVTLSFQHLELNWINKNSNFFCLWMELITVWQWKQLFISAFT